jgi:hypothetical protein
VLALACLEHATELDPRVRAEVERRAAAVIPPRTVREARALAEAGPLALELLPGPEGLSDEEARAVVVTASLIGTEAALPVLARFRAHPSLEVRAQLTWTWHRFPERPYGEEVIAHLRETGLFFAAHSAGRLRFLRELGGRRKIQLTGDLPADAIAAGLVPERTRKLIIRDNDALRDLGCLAALRRLTHLDLSRAPHVDDLTPLAGLPLTWLSLDLLPGLERPGALRALAPCHPTLDQLDVGVCLEAESLDEAVPVDLPLRYLRLTKAALRHTGLRGLHRFHRLRQLSLARLHDPLTAPDHEEIARLPELTELRINWQAVGWQGPPLPGITSLRLNDFQGTEDLTRIPELFPGLRRVTIVLAPSATEIPDGILAPLPVQPAIRRIRSVV